MNYIKNYKIFLESFQISDSDEPDVKLAKEKMNTLESQISYYKANKSKIDSIYSNSENNEEIEKELEKILGKSDSQNGNRNPFLVQYAHLAKLERSINKLQDDNSNDKIKIDDLQQSLRLSEDETTKKSVQFKISDIKNRMSERYSKINDIKKDLSEKEKEHNTKISKIGEEMKKHIAKISSPDKK
jgi:hypothetical protein